MGTAGMEEEAPGASTDARVHKRKGGHRLTETARSARTFQQRTRKRKAGDEVRPSKTVRPAQESLFSPPPKNPAMHGRILIPEMPPPPSEKKDKPDRTIDSDRKKFAQVIQSEIEKHQKLVGWRKKDASPVQMDQIVPHRATDPRSIAENIENRVHAFFSNKMYSEKFRNILTKRDRSIPLSDQIKACSLEIQKKAKRIFQNTKEENRYRVGLNTTDTGLHEDNWRNYKHFFTQAKGKLSSLNDLLCSYPCNTNISIQPKPLRFPCLTFVEKIVVIWQIFSKRFECTANSRYDPLGILPASIKEYLSIPCFFPHATKEEKKVLRTFHFNQLADMYGMRIKDFVGVFTFCVRHYAREEKWKKEFVYTILEEECPCLAQFWHTTEDGPWMRNLDLWGILQSLGLNFNFILDTDSMAFVHRYSCMFGMHKRNRIHEFFREILEDENIAIREASEMELKEISEPTDDLEEMCSEQYQCEHCESYRTKFLFESQTRSCDEGSTFWVKCKECFQLTKFSDDK